MKLLILTTIIAGLPFISGTSTFAADCSKPDSTWTKPFVKGDNSVYTGEVQSNCNFTSSGVTDLGQVAQKLIARDEAEAAPGTQAKRTSSGPQVFSTEITVKLPDAGDTRLNQRITVSIQGSVLTYSAETIQVISQGQKPWVSFVNRETHFTLSANVGQPVQLSYRSSIALKKGMMVPESQLIPRTSASLAGGQLSEVSDLVHLLN